MKETKVKDARLFDLRRIHLDRDSNIMYIKEKQSVYMSVHIFKRQCPVCTIQSEILKDANYRRLGFRLF